jgi:uncharacterized membrane protein YidH (DUF202 family)
VGPDCATEKRWYRNPNIVLPPTEITRFPHAVLEVKLSLKEGTDAPQWVQDLLTSSGLCTQVHKFSKFIHGSAVLLTDQVQALPYWIDDLSLRPSVLRSQPVKQRRSLLDRQSSLARKQAPGLVVAHEPVQLMPRRPSLITQDDTTPLVGGDLDYREPLTGALGRKPRKTPMKVEPKVFFSNERTLLGWLHMSVTLGALSAALLGYSSANRQEGAGLQDNSGAQLIGFVTMPVAILFAAYAYRTFMFRRKYLRLKLDMGYFFDETGPLLLGTAMVASLVTVFVSKVLRLI